MKQILLAFILVFTFGAFAQPEAYRLFTSTGKKASYSKMLTSLRDADIILFGELHDDPIAHWLQLVITKELFAAKGADFMLGAEMIERDQQEKLNNYLSGKWNLETFNDSTKMWINFGTDYLPVINFAKDNKIPYIATNIPRPYASRVFKRGLISLDSLSANEKQWVVPLPFPMDTSLSQYRELIKMGMEMHSSGLNFAYAQAIKDATMAYSILQYRKPGKQVLHFNGSYHSDFHQGIEWYLKKTNPNLKIVTISTVGQEDVKKLDTEFKDKADYIIAVPSAMTRTME